MNHLWTMLRAHLNTFEGFQIKTKIVVDTKLTTVMWCHF